MVEILLEAHPERECTFVLARMAPCCDRAFTDSVAGRCQPCRDRALLAECDRAARGEA